MKVDNIESTWEKEKLFYPYFHSLVENTYSHPPLSLGSYKGGNVSFIGHIFLFVRSFFFFILFIFIFFCHREITSIIHFVLKLSGIKDLKGGKGIK